MAVFLVPKDMRPIGTAEELQPHSLRPVALIYEGESPEDVAHFLGCGRSSVSTWLKLAREGPEALAAEPHPGRTARLTDGRLRELERLLTQRGEAHGWRTDLWTAARAAELIERHSGLGLPPRACPQAPQAAAAVDQPEAAGAGRGGGWPLNALRSCRR